MTTFYVTLNLCEFSIIGFNVSHQRHCIASRQLTIQRCTKKPEKSLRTAGKKIDSGGIRTHASEETGALNQRLRPLGHATIQHFMLDNYQPLVEEAHIRFRSRQG